MLKEQMNLTAAIVRTYNFSGIGEFVQRLLSFGIRHVIVVVPHDQDNGVTAPILAAFDSSRVHLVERSFEKGGRAWSAMLNAGLDYIEGRFRADFDDFIDYVLMVSNTVLLEAEHLEALYAAMSPGVVVAGASFKGVGKQGEDVPLGPSYNHHFRNTLALYQATAFQGTLAGFDEVFDGAGGMEDLAWKLMFEGLTPTDCAARVVENVVEVPLLVHTHRTPVQQAEYEALLEEGMKAAEEHVAWFFRERD
ncbi:MAG: hypothetical protein KBD65_02500 [Candidatus Moranbacteria bacterium]|nr:hypothetical protein [Candidatus Moranbacteria bacterium]